ncbi:hypothetical protein [Halorussus salinus]|nr:hypothetical protein [Halorussus salinus]
MPDARLLLEGVSPEEITAGFLTDVMDTADEHELPLDGISLLQQDPDE